MKSAHPDFIDLQNLTIVHVKDRWTDEERRMLARCEAHTVVEAKGSQVFLNQELQGHFDRTIESMKGQRRNASHKSLVAQFNRELEQTTRQAKMHPPVGVTSSVTTVHDTANMNRLALHLRDLPKVNPNKFRLAEQFDCLLLMVQNSDK